MRQSTGEVLSDLELSGHDIAKQLHAEGFGGRSLEAIRKRLSAPSYIHELDRLTSRGVAPVAASPLTNQPDLEPQQTAPADVSRETIETREESQESGLLGDSLPAEPLLGEVVDSELPNFRTPSSSSENQEQLVENLVTNENAEDVDATADCNWVDALKRAIAEAGEPGIDLESIRMIFEGMYSVFFHFSRRADDGNQRMILWDNTNVNM